MTTEKDFNRVSTWYEWSYQCIDRRGDIIDHDHQERLNRYPEKLLDCHTDGCVRHDLELWRTTGNEAQGVIDRGFALVEDGKLPEYTDNGAKVPVRFHEELERWKA